MTMPRCKQSRMFLSTVVFAALLVVTQTFVPHPHRTRQQITTSTTIPYGGFVGSTLRARCTQVLRLGDTTTSERPGKKSTHKKSSIRHKNNNKIKCSPNSCCTTTETWRVFGIEVHPDLLFDEDSRKDNTNNDLHPAIWQALHKRLNTNRDMIKQVQLVRRSLDARSYPRRRRADGGTGPRFVFVLDVTLNGKQQQRWKHQPGRLERFGINNDNNQTVAITNATTGTTTSNATTIVKPRVVIVGAGPAGLFCALRLAQSGLVQPIVLERGQPVECRGRDIGALMHRGRLDAESNFCFGEGGAGTWSDGKLTTRIGRNAHSVRNVLEILVKYGAPANILVDGAPHLGTDNLVKLLRNMRTDLRKMGGEIHFGTRVTGLTISKEGIATGVQYCIGRTAVERNTVMNAHEGYNMGDRGIMTGDAIVLATGHSARDMYEQLFAAGVSLEAKGFAVGFRVEHPQSIINKIQYGNEWAPSVLTGRRTTDDVNMAAQSNITIAEQHCGKLPVPSYRLATDRAFDGVDFRGAYSFCMCPGGQIVPTSTDSNEVCVNGMSFSRRDSLWANSALVVTVAPNDVILDSYRSDHSVLAGLAFQKDMERRASVMGGGNLTVPVQRLTDFVVGRPSTSAPPSSYRLGVKPAACHEIYPVPLVTALRCALTEHFDKQMPGFVCEDGLLHAVETRTSSPVRIVRDEENMEAVGCKNLFPTGEGAGFAGGIVSAAVDGHGVAESILVAIGGDMSSRCEPKIGSTAADTFY